MIIISQNYPYFVSCFLLLAMIPVSGSMLLSCGDDTDNTDTSTLDSDTVAAVDTEPSYDYGTLNLNDGTIAILSSTNPYNFYDSIDFEKQTGDTLDDSIYNRNRALEEQYNFKFEIDTSKSFDQVAGYLQTLVLANEDVFDAVFMRDQYLQTLILEGYLYDLSETSNFKFDMPWWDGALIEATRIGNSSKIYFAQTDISLTDFEGTVVTFFNEDMLKNLDLDMPYQLVRDGKWTFDKLCEYQKYGANLNGDNAFVPFDASGNATYGQVGSQHTYNAIISSAGIDYVVNENGTLKLGIADERFYDVAIKMSEALATDGDYLDANNASSNSPEHYEMIFRAGRSLFMMAQLKASNVYRDMEDTFGILPIPKWDASQKNYSNLRSFSYMMSVPITNSDLDSTATVMDAMSYLTYRDVMPYFIEGRTAQKNLRNEESIEMLELVQATRHMDIGRAYGMYNTIQNEIRDIVGAKSTNFASMVKSIQASAESQLEDLMEYFNN